MGQGCGRGGGSCMYTWVGLMLYRDIEKSWRFHCGRGSLSDSELLWSCVVSASWKSGLSPSCRTASIL